MLRQIQGYPRCLFYLLLILSLPILANAQEKRVSGQVLSGQDQKPLAGVSVVIKGGTTGTVTDAGGVFSLRVSNGAVLVFSFEGYAPVEWRVRDNRGIRVQLNLTGKALQDVVVVGYGTQRKSDLTGSIASVNTKELSSLPVPDIGQALEGRAAGVQVVASGAPGSNVSFLIRGAGTINDASPL